MSGFYIGVLILFIILCSIIISWKAVYIYKISKHPFPKFIGSFTILLLALIAFIFSIHAEIFSSYDRLNSKLKNSYNWFDPSDIVKFPIEQFKIHKRVFPLNIISLDSCFLDQYDRKYTIVIDKTPSTELDSFTKNISQKLINSLNSSLQSSVSQNGLDLDKLAIEDLVVLSALKQLTQNTQYNNLIEVIYYLGDDKFKSPFDIDLSVTKENLCIKFKEYIKYFNDSIFDEKRGKYTNFGKIINKLKEPTFLGNNCKAFTNVFFISDFEHEELSGTSFTELNGIFRSFNDDDNININQLNLIKIKGEKNNIEKINLTLELFRENYNHLYFYEFNENLIYFDEKPLETISAIFSSAKNNMTQQAVFLYYLWNDSLNRSDFIGNLTFKSTSFKSSEIIIGLRDKVDTKRYYDFSSYLLLNGSKTKIHPFTSTQLPFDNKISYRTTFSTEKNFNNNYYLELSVPESTYKICNPIILRDIIPETSCVYLIYFYSFLFITLSCLILYFILCIWHSHESRFRIKQVLVILIFACFLFLFLKMGIEIFANYISLLFNLFNTRYSLLFIVVILSTITLNGFFFNFSYKKEVKKLKQLLNEE